MPIGDTYSSALGMFFDGWPQCHAQTHAVRRKLWVLDRLAQAPCRGLAVFSAFASLKSARLRGMRSITGFGKRFMV